MPMRPLFMFLYILISASGFSQNKIIKGDTIIYNQHNSLRNKFELKDFSKTDENFAFRLKMSGQFIEICKNDSIISGVIINYTFREKSKKNRSQDTIFSKVILDEKDIIAVVDYINKSGVLELPSGNKILNWTGGFDGTTYVIEHANKDSYWYKTYWTPSIQDSVPEALIINDFVDFITDTLNLIVKYNAFSKTLPHKGCYRSGGIRVKCYSPDLITIGYSGSVKLPLGLNISRSISYIGNKRIGLGVIFNYQQNAQNNKDISATISKYKLINYKNSKISDYLFYNYRYRNILFSKTEKRAENHIIQYGLNLPGYISLSVGTDYLIRDKNEFGAAVSLSKYIKILSIRAYVRSSLFDTHTDYKVGFYHIIYIRDWLSIKGLRLGLEFEEFYGERDLYFKFSVYI